jgi:pullulanase/glycogen debranching enzyme
MKRLNLILLLTFFINFSAGEKLFISDKHSRITSNFLSKQTLTKTKNQDSYYSTKELGAIVENGTTTFRLFTPNAQKVVLSLFDSVDQEIPTDYEMTRDEDAVWEITIDNDLSGKFYGFKVYHDGENLDNTDKVVCVDPYAKAVATYTDFMNPRKSIVVGEDNFDWEETNWIQRDWKDLIIYEMHIRDATIHPSSEVENKGSYKGLTEKGKKGGLSYIKDLGVNTVELLPAHEFGYVEIPYRDSLAGRYNTWNPYERNHWGYMTSNYFAPAAYYTMSNDTLKLNQWIGVDGSQITEFKEMVKAFHKEDIGVMMDVVYNHLSEYEIANLKEIDKEYYFRLDQNGNFIAESYCGNDIRTEAPMMRRLIVESIIYWMKEYHIDGFRFDLGKLIDWETIEDIIHEAKKINPNVVFVCEPWGGGYDPKGFSLRGWGAWNDQIRNGVKGENPFNGHGWIFGKWFGDNSPKRIKSYVNGTLIRDSLGLFQKKDHSVNYLESHDGYTLGDFIRLGLGNVGREEIITDIEKNAKLTETQLKLNKLGALFLFTSQGITMIHQGQEFARSKVIPTDNDIEDSHKGMLDHNTYNKDNSVNYINYDHAEMNSELFDYYKGLIQLRKEYSAFRRADYENVHFFNITDNEFALGYLIKHEDQTFIVLFNADTDINEEFVLPKGDWEIIVNENEAGIETIDKIEDKVTLNPSTGMVLRLSK